MPIRLANYLKENHYRVAVHCVKKNGDEKIESLLDPDIPVYYTDRYWKLAAILIGHNYKYIHSHCIASQMLFARTRKRISMLQTKHMATLHGGYEGIEREKAIRLIKENDPYVTCWTYVADNNLPILQAAGVPAGKVTKIGNAMVRPDFIQKVDMSIYGIPAHAYVFTVVTRAVSKKCWKECIETIQEARKITGKEIHLVLCGTGPLYDEIKKQPIDSYIHLVGEINNPCDYYAASYCGLLLSVRECEPLGLIEMYYAGKPVIATDTGEIAQMISGDGKDAGILVPLTENGMVSVKNSAEAVSRMVNDPKLYAACAEAAARKANQYQMETVVKRYLECLAN